MLYISSRKGEKFGVTDTKDKVEEFYTKAELFGFTKRGLTIMGVRMRGNLFTVEHFMMGYGEILNADIKTPVLVTYYPSRTKRQCLILEVNESGLYLFDEGTFIIP